MPTHGLAIFLTASSEILFGLPWLNKQRHITATIDPGYNSRKIKIPRENNKAYTTQDSSKDEPMQ